MTRYEKIAISLPSRAAEHVRRVVKEGRAASASAYIARAIEEHAANEGLAAMLDRMLLATGGPMTPKESARADARLGIASAPSGRTKPRSSRTKRSRGSRR